MSKSSVLNKLTALSDKKLSERALAPIVAECCSQDQHDLRMALRKVLSVKGLKDKQNDKDAAKQKQLVDDLMTKIQASLQQVSQRRESLPNIPFSDDLPINQRREEIAELISNNQVVVIAGETGSGKTTQIPKICLSIGLGNKGLIGHTQPRRIAARTVGKRIADELKTPFGDVIGYQVRFADQLSDNTRVKLMTDGVLLAEFQQDRFLSKYEVIIIDEAHERSLNIDFLLGLLKRLLKKRKDLKLIITSATIDLEKFAKHFTDKDNKAAPIIEVSGRTYPVDVLYDPLPQETFVDLSDAIANSVDSIIDGEARGEFIAKGDILIFCAGEREIRDAAKALRDRQLPVDILPLYSRLSIAEQNKVFQKAQRRKVVLATNVAETSITVPGIAYVIDPGVARISRHSYRSKVQRLQVEPISQASANQRMGRCGRVANGVCVRLYSEEDFNARPAFTDAELLRSNLAAVILQLLQLRIHDVDDFPFIDKPDKRLLNDGFKLLYELQAIDDKQQLSKLGRTVSRIPLDPKYARMLLAANTLGCLSEVLIIVAALSIQDPREFPGDKQQAAREKHRLLQHPKSDFISYLALWFSIEQQRQALSRKQFKEYCQKNFLSIVRIFEWHDMVRQLKQTMTRLNWQLNTVNEQQQAEFLPNGLKSSLASKSSRNDGKQNKQYKTAEKHTEKQCKTTNNSEVDNIHRALLTGLLSNIAIHDENNDYLATRGRKLVIFPASGLAKKIKPKKHKQADKKSKAPTKNAKWIMANELIETSRLFAHTAAEILPHWVQKVGEHLLNYQYSTPNYHERAGAVKALRIASIYGLTLRDKTAVVYSEFAPEECRRLFIQQALIEGAYAKHPNYKINEKTGRNFFAHNQELINKIEQVEAKQRRRNLLVADTEIYELYAERIPDDIVNWVEFEQWRKTTELSQPDVLKFRQEQLLIDENALNDEQGTESNLDNRNEAAFPSNLMINDKALPLSYHFNPKDPHDGVTITLPISLLEPFPDHIGDWLVPGLLKEKCVALIKTLPKAIRKRYAPAAHAVDRVIETMQPENTPLHIVLGDRLKRKYGEEIPDDSWGLAALDDYYKLNYHLVDSDKAQTSIQQSRDLAALKQSYSEYVAESLRIENAPERNQYEQYGITEWDFGELLEQVEYQHQGMTVRAYPMLQIQLDSPDTDLSNVNAEPSQLALLLHQSPLHAEYFTRKALLVLAKQALKQNIQYLKKSLFKANQSRLQLLAIAPNKEAQNALIIEVIDSAINYCCFQGSLPRSNDEFMQQLNNGRAFIVEYAIELEAALLSNSKRLGELRSQMSSLGDLSIQTDEIIEDIKNQLYEMFCDGFLQTNGLHQIKQYPRYLKSLQQRIEQLHSNKMLLPSALSKHQSEFDKTLTSLIKSIKANEPSKLSRQAALELAYRTQPCLSEHVIMLMEWRVSIFTQHLKTQYPVSEKRVLAHWESCITKLKQTFSIRH